MQLLSNNQRKTVGFGGAGEGAGVKFNDSEYERP